MESYPPLPSSSEDYEESLHPRSGSPTPSPHHAGPANPSQEPPSTETPDHADSQNSNSQLPASSVQGPAPTVVPTTLLSQQPTVSASQPLPQPPPQPQQHTSFYKAHSLPPKVIKVREPRSKSSLQQRLQIILANYTQRDDLPPENRHRAFFEEDEVENKILHEHDLSRDEILKLDDSLKRIARMDTAHIKIGVEKSKFGVENGFVTQYTLSASITLTDSTGKSIKAFKEDVKGKGTGEWSSGLEVDVLVLVRGGLDTRRWDMMGFKDVCTELRLGIYMRWDENGGSRKDAPNFEDEGLRGWGGGRGSGVRIETELYVFDA